MDFQSSINSLWGKDRANYDNPPLYDVLVIALEKFADIRHKIQSVDGLVLIDLPGKIDDDLLVPVYRSADLVICPFAYDKITFESTAIFAQVVRHLNKSVPLVFVPNRLKAGVKYEIKSKVNEILGSFGRVTPELPDRVAFQRLDTVSIPEEVNDLVQLAFDPICEQHINKPS